MKEQAQYRHIEEFKAKLTTRRGDFEKQLEKVRKHYPLVAVALSMQEAAIAEIAYPRRWEVLSIYSSLTKTPTPYPDPELAHRLRECFQSLDRSLAQSRGDEQSAAYAFGALPNCLRSAYTHAGSSK